MLRNFALGCREFLAFRDLTPLAFSGGLSKNFTSVLKGVTFFFDLSAELCTYIN